MRLRAVGTLNSGIDHDRSSEKEVDQLSDSSVNAVTPSPRQSPAETIADKAANHSLKPSAIILDSDDRISGEELDTIKQICKTTWFLETLSYVRGLPTTKRLNRLVRLCYRIHELRDFPNVDGRANEQKLSITSRPAYFDCWMKAHRPLKKGRVPTLNHDEQLKFLSEFQNWWSSLQPGWRTLLHSDAFTRTGPLHSDWESLSRAGPNGVALVVLSLAWLTAYFRSDNPLFSTFVLYIEDTTWAFLQVIQWMEASPHIISSITHEPPSSSPSPKKKVRRNK